MNDRRAGRAGQRQQAGLVLAQGRHEVLVAGHATQQLDQYRAPRDALFDRTRPLLQRDLQRQDLAHELAGGTHVVGQAPWLHGVARHQPPQAAFMHQRYRHRCAGPHVAHVLQVDRRDAAQHGQAQVGGWCVAMVVGPHQRRGGVVVVRDQAHPVAAVEFAGLRRNVRFGEAQVKVGRQQAVAILGHHDAIPAGIELIDQGAVKAGQPAHVRGSQLAEVFHGAGRLDPGHQLADGRIQFFQRAGLAGNRRFQLDQQIGGGAVQQQLMAAMAIQMHGTDMRAAADRRLLEQRLERRQRTAKHLADMLRQRLAELLQQPRMADGALEHLQGLRLNDQKHTVRLDRAGGMDRFARAAGRGGVVRGFSRRHQGQGSWFVDGWIAQ